MANEVYITDGTPILFGSGSGEVAWTTESVSDGAGRQSAFTDLGAAPREFLYRFRFWAQFNAAPTVGGAIRIYAKTAEDNGGGSPQHPDNDDGTGDAAVSAEDKLRNLKHVATLSVDEASSGVEMVASGVVAIHARHLSIVLWNEGGAALSSTASHTKLRLTPIAEQLQ